MRIAKYCLAVVSLLAACFAAFATSGVRWSGSQRSQSQAVQYTKDGKLVRPKDYREWIFLSSGIGMTYGSGNTSEPTFDNVFVNPAAYRSFVQTGLWPEKTVLVVEGRKSAAKGSIVTGGRFQTDLEAIEVEVKDSSRPSKWTFYGFNGSTEVGTAFPTTANCYSCHRDNTAVDNTFVQFYPTLIPIAKAKGTFRNLSEN